MSELYQEYFDELIEKTEGDFETDPLVLLLTTVAHSYLDGEITDKEFVKLSVEIGIVLEDVYHVIHGREWWK